MATMLEGIQRRMRGEGPPAPVADLIGFRLVAVGDGSATVEFEAGERHANPMGTLYGGILCDIADAAMGMAYASTLGDGESFTTLELKINFLKQPDTIRAALRGIEKVFLVGPPAPNIAELEGGLVNEAKKSGVKHIVKLSALGDRKAIFPGLHRDSEEKVEASGLPYTFLRPNGFMQNFVNYNSGTIKTQNAFHAAQGNGAVSHIDIRDIASVAVRVLSGTGNEGKAYSLTGPEALTNEQIAEKLSRVLGRIIHYVDVPPDDFRKGLLSAGVPKWSADALLDLQRLYREGGASLVDPTVERLMGRKATSFDDFARDYSFAFQQDARAAS